MWLRYAYILNALDFFLATNDFLVYCKVQKAQFKKPLESKNLL